MTPTIEITPDGDRFRWVLVTASERIEGTEPYSSETVAHAAAARQVRALNMNARTAEHRSPEELG